MSPRKRAIPDSDVVAAAARSALKHGAEHVRLADVAAESGLAAATLVQRFGSRDGLLDAIARHFVAEMAAAFQGSHSSELLRLHTALSQIPILAHLAFFAARPGSAPGYSLELRKHIAFSLAQAVEDGALAPCDVAVVARCIQLSYYGAATACRLEGIDFGPGIVPQIIAEQLDPYR